MARDLILIRLVAGRYRELQGLRRVVDGASLVVMWTLAADPAGPVALAMVGILDHRLLVRAMRPGVELSPDVAS